MSEILVQVRADDLERLIAYAEIGANGLSGQARLSAIDRVRYVEAQLVTERERYVNRKERG